MFTALAIITMLKYKLRIEYTFKSQKIPISIVWGINCFTGMVVICCVFLPTVTTDRHVSDKAVLVLEIILQSCLLISLSVSSALIFWRLRRHFKLHNQWEVGKRVLCLEVMIQMIIATRLVCSGL